MGRTPRGMVAPTPLHELAAAASLPAMNALEILRETARILRANPSPFMSVLALLICPVSAALLSNALIDAAVVAAAARHLIALAAASGLPRTHFLKQVCHHLAGTFVSYAVCFPLLATLLLAARAAAAYAVSCVYTGRKFIASEFATFAARIWRRVALTYFCTCTAICGCLLTFLALLVVVCNTLAVMQYPADAIVYAAFITVLGFSMVYAHTIIICNLAGVITVLENASGASALLRSLQLVRGQTQAGLLIFLGSTIGLAFVEGLFEHRVKTLSYGDGSSRIWEGPLLVLMYSFVVLIDSMMCVVFYFTCRSSMPDDLIHGEGVEQQVLAANELEVDR